MTQDESPTLESVRADIDSKIAKAKAGVPALAKLADAAEKAMDAAALAHSKNRNLPALLEASGKHTEAVENLAVAEAGVKREENRLTAHMADRQREADRVVVDSIITKARAKCPDMHTIHDGLSVSGSIPVADLSPTKDELAVCERHDRHAVTVTTTREEGKPAVLALSFFGKVKRARSGNGGGGGRAGVFNDGAMTGSAQDMAEAHKPESAAKIAAQLADGKNASYAHIAAGLVKDGVITQLPSA